MKKLLFLGAMAAMLLGTASCSNDMEPAMGDDDMVRFTIEMPGNVDSRAIADGNTANQLTVAVYDAAGNELPDIRVNKEIPHQTTVEFKLVKGQKYSFAFWAQAAGAPYTFNTANKTVSVSYTDAKSNDEKRDAFYAYRADLTVNGPTNETIYLYRPFAQLNYGASDLADAIKAGVNVTKSAVTVKKAATSFNLATGATDGEAEVTFTKEILPDAKTVDNVFTPAKLTVEETQYDWMAMNYFLVPNNQATIETSLLLYEGDATEAVRDITVDNVPVQKNHRTNIVGNLFTEDVNFNVIIDERFDQPDYNRDLNRPQVPDGYFLIGNVISDDLAEAIEIANGEPIYMGKGTYDTQITVGDGETVKLIAGQNLNPEDVVLTKQVKANSGSTLELTGISVETTATADARTSAAIDITNATATLDGVYTSGQRGINIDNGSNVVIKNSILVGDKGTYQRGVNIMNENNQVEISGSEIRAGWYAINLVGTAANNNIKIENSDIYGWAAVNIHKNGNMIEFNNCKINAIGNYSGTSNSFAAFVYDGSGNATNNTIKVTNSTVLVEALADQPMALLQVLSANNTFYCRNTNIIGKVPMREALIPDMWFYGTGNKSSFTLDIDETIGGSWNGTNITYEIMMECFNLASEW